MEKTKLGVSVGLLAAAVYLTAFFNSTAMFLIVGYILLCESNEWLKKSAVKAVAVVLVCGVISAAAGALGNVFDIINSFFNGAGISLRINFPLNLDNIISYLVSIFKTLILIVLGFTALSQGSVKIGFIDKILDKEM